MDESMPEGLQGAEIFWLRAQDAFKGKDKSLWGDGFSHEDINQGVIGNCWFLAAASAVAEKPERMAQVFLNKEKDLNRQGLYMMNFWQLGVPSTIVVDDYLPLREDKEKGSYKGYFAKPARDGSMWPLFLEKAFAKLHGNYLHLEAGIPILAV